VGKVAGIAATSVGNKRIIQISEYAEVSRPVSWDKSRNPVLYRNLAERGFDIASLQWKPVPAQVAPDEALDEPAPALETDEHGVLPLSIAQAKQGLAAYFQVSPDQVEITVRF